LNSIRGGEPSSSLSWPSVGLIGIGAMIRIALSPLRAQYPNASQALNPATNVASGQQSATSS
jgi:hypothetical protein